MNQVNFFVYELTSKPKKLGDDYGFFFIIFFTSDWIIITLLIIFITYPKINLEEKTLSFIKNRKKITAQSSMKNFFTSLISKIGK